MAVARPRQPQLLARADDRAAIAQPREDVDAGAPLEVRRAGVDEAGPLPIVQARLPQVDAPTAPMREHAEPQAVAGDPDATRRADRHMPARQEA